MALKSILLTVPSLAVIDGGPPVVVSELSLALAEFGVSVHILTCSASQEPECLPRHAKVLIHRLSSRWCPGLSLRLGSLLHSESPPQLVHDFGLWQPIHHHVASVADRLNLPYVNSPSGMLAPRALAQKTWKKRLAWALYQHRCLSRAALLVASSATEARQLQRLLPDNQIAVVSHGVRLPDFINAVPPASAPAFSNAQPHPLRTVLFLGRLDPVKGLPSWIAAWSRVRPRGWRCVLAGPGPVAYQSHLQELTVKAGCAPDFHFYGPVHSNQKWELLRDADLLVLPSESENFGLAVAEALAVGVPVITTRATPWAELNSVGCGWVVPLSTSHLAEALSQATTVPDDERRLMGSRGRAWITRQFTWPAAAERLRALYTWTLAAGPLPECLSPTHTAAVCTTRPCSDRPWLKLLGASCAPDPDSRA